MESPCKKSAKGVVLTPSSSCLITNLPEPILMEILCLLPIKTLVTSKSVCKSWLHLIRDPLFSQLLQARAPTEVCFQRLYEFNTTKLYMGNFNNFGPIDVKFDTLLTLSKFSVSSTNVVDYNDVGAQLYFANSCNGLLCYYGKIKSKRFAVLWNPCTSDFVTIPPPCLHKGYPSCRDYGLGFSIKANKFKLVRFRGRKVKGSSAEPEVVVAELYSTEKASSWRIVAQFPFDYPVFPKNVSSGTFFQGTLHWAIVNDYLLSEVFVLTFNFEDDLFGRIPLPPSFAKTLSKMSVSSCRPILGVLGGCLFISEYTNEGVSIWLMKEYGVEASWTKLFCFGFTLMEEYCIRDSLPKPFRENIRYHCCLPICYMDNGEILMTCTHSVSTTVFFYNPVLKSVKSYRFW